MATNRRLSIAYVGTLPPHQGGSAVMCGQLVAELARRGHDVRAVAPMASGSGSTDGFADGHPTVQVARYEVPYFLNNPYTVIPPDYERHEHAEAERTLATVMDGWRPDVVVLGRENFVWLVDVTEAHGLPSLLILHGGPSTAIRDGLYSTDRANAHVRLCRRVTRRVTMAQHWQRALADMGIEDVGVIPNPVDLERFRPKAPAPELARELDIDADAIVVLHASNLKPIKRPLDVVESAERALLRDPRLVYVIVGEGHLRGELEQSCARKGLVDRFRFLDWVPHDRMCDLLNLADMVVMPSAHETQAMTYLEAQACGRVLLASDVPGAREVVDDGVTGLLFRRGDVDDLTARTLAAAADPNLRAAIGRRARERAQRHAIDGVIDRYEALLREVAAG